MKRSTLKTASQLTLAALVIGSMQINGFSSAYAQAIRPGVGGFGNTVTVAPGTYEQVDVKAPAFLEVFQKMDANDSQWMKDTVSEINTAIANLKDTQAKLVNLANSSMQLPLGMELKDYLAATGTVAIEIQALKTKIEVLTSVPSARNANNVAKLSSGSMTVTGSGALQSINISKIASIMDEKFKNVEASINGITFYIHALNPAADAASPRTAQVLGQPLAESLLKNFTPDEINALASKAKKDEANAKLQLIDRSNKIGKPNLARLKFLVAEYGQKERYQFRKTDEQGLIAAQTSVSDMYMARSVLRYYFAVPVGAFGTPVDTRRPFSFQQVPLANSNEIVIDDSVTLSTEDLLKKRLYIFTALQTQNDWAGNNNGKGLWERIKNPLSNISNMVNFLAFREGWSKMNAFVLQNMLNEIQEELAMNEPGGLVAVKTMVKAKIAASADPVATKTKVASMLNIVNTAEGQIDETSAIGAAGTNATLKDTATAVQQYLTSINAANALRKQAADLRKLSNAYSKGQKARASDLLD